MSSRRRRLWNRRKMKNIRTSKINQNVWICIFSSFFSHFSDESVPTPESERVKLCVENKFKRRFRCGVRWIVDSLSELSASSIIFAICESKTADESSSNVRWSFDQNLFSMFNDWEIPRSFAAIEFSDWRATRRFLISSKNAAGSRWAKLYWSFCCFVNFAVR